VSKGKRKPASASGYRAPKPAPEPARRGILDTLFTPRSTTPSPMPSIRSSFTRGLATVLSTPVILGWVAVAVFLEWVALVAIGFQGPFSYLSAVFAWPGPGTYVDGQLSSLVFGSSRGALFSIFGFMLVRSFVLALLSAMVVERLRTGAISTWSVRRSLHVMPVAFAANMVGLGLLLVAGIAGQFLGQLGLGFFVFAAGLFASVWITAAALAISVDEDRPLAGTMQRSLRTARIPGSGGLTLAALYTIPAFAATSALTFSGHIEINPSIGRWAAVLGINLVHATMAAVFAYRYLAAAPFIPEAPAPAPRSRVR